MSSQREAEAAKELLLTRLMGVHPEVYGGGRARLNGDNQWYIEIELSEPFPSYVRHRGEFFGFPVVFRVTGWKPGLMPYQVPDD